MTETNVLNADVVVIGAVLREYRQPFLQQIKARGIIMLETAVGSLTQSFWIIEKILNIKRKLAVVILIFFVFLGMGSEAYAAEGVLPVGPIGGTDIGQALPPTPGLYVTGVGVGAHFNHWYNKWNSKENATGHNISFAGGVMYVPAHKLWGGTISSSLQAGYGDLCTRVGRGADRSCSRGMDDMFWDAFAWSKLYPDRGRMEANPSIPYGLAVRYSLGFQIPVGHYRKHKDVNLGANFWDIVPSLALTYTGPSILGSFFGQATEYSGRIFYHLYTKNHATGYHTGDVISLDFALTERYNAWQYGIAGYWYSQIENDNFNGISVPDNRGRTIIMGPIIQRTVVIDGRPWIGAIKGGYGLGGSHSADVGPSIVFRVTTKV